MKTNNLTSEDGVIENINENTNNCAETKQLKFNYTIIDHISHFTGLGISSFYILAALVTVWEVVARYIFNAPTQWAFEVVMVLCAGAWMFSSGFITLKKRHIGITVIHDIVSKKVQDKLDTFAMIVGIVALFLLMSDATLRSLLSVESIERTGSAFNSPMPMFLKVFLACGGLLYLTQLTLNLYRHVSSKLAKSTVKIVGIAMFAYFVNALLAFVFGSESIFGIISHTITDFAYLFDISEILDMQSIGLGFISIIMILALIALMMTGMSLGIVTLIVSVIMALAFFGPKGLYLVSANAAGLLDHYALVAIPFFVLMASVLERAGIAKDLFDAMSVLAGNLRGGVAVQTVVVAVILAAMSGVMGGEIVMLGLVALPQMLRLGYDRKLVIGLICAAGALATLIPPSITMIVYGLSAEVGIGDLFMAGAVPGLMLAVFYSAYVLLRVNLNHSLAPTAEEIELITGEKNKLSKKRLGAVFLSILLIMFVMGSIYGGIASVTEAASLGALGAMIIAAIRLEFNWKLLSTALVGTMSTVGTIIWLVIGAVSFVGIFNLVGGGDFMRSMFLDLDVPAMGVILIMMLVLMVLGTFMEWIAIVLIVVPVFAPVIVTLAPELGLSPDDAKIWFGVLFVMNIQIYFLSPPFGPACFWLKSVAPKDVSLQEIFVSVMPFIGLQIIGLGLVIMFPEIALWLPGVLSD